MYQISWFDTRDGETHKLKVHTSRAVSDVTRTLQNSSRYADVQVTYSAPRRLREIVIVFEN